MFTGIINHIGTVGAIEKQDSSARISILLPGEFKDRQLGESVAINGTCLTIVENTDDSAIFEVGPETMQKTSIGLLQKGQKVNIEFPLTMADPLGGHFVQGHVDGRAEIVGLERKEEATTLTIKLPEELHRQTILHGSITVDGVSLTIAQRNDKTISIMLMPYTLDKTIFADSKVGDKVNIEVDMLAKYIAQQMKHYNK